MLPSTHPALAPILKSISGFGIWGGKCLRFVIVPAGHAKFRRELDEGGVRELGVGSISLASDRSMVYLFLAADS